MRQRLAYFRQRARAIQLQHLETQAQRFSLVGFFWELGRGESFGFPTSTTIQHECDGTEEEDDQGAERGADAYACLGGWGEG